jgi:hypothetical protein
MLAVLFAVDKPAVVETLEPGVPPLLALVPSSLLILSSG